MMEYWKQNKYAKQIILHNMQLAPIYLFPAFLPVSGFKRENVKPEWNIPS